MSHILSRNMPWRRSPANGFDDWGADRLLELVLAARRGKDVASMHLNALRDRFVSRRVAGVKRDDEIDALGIVRADVGLEEQDAIGDIKLLSHLPRRLDDIGTPVNANDLRIGVAKHMNEVKV